MSIDETTTTVEEPDFLPQRLWDLFARPGRLMKNVGRWPRWWMAGLLIVVINGVATTWEGPVLLEEYRGRSHSSALNSLVSEKDFLDKLENSVGSGEGSKFSSVISSGMNSWGGTLVFSLVLGFFAKMAGGKGSFSQALGIVHWAALIPYGLGTLVKLVLVLNTGEFARITLSPAVFLPVESVGSFFFILLDSFADVTILWGLVVVVIGFGKVFKLDRSPASLSVFMPWVLITAVTAGFRLMLGL